MLMVNKNPLIVREKKWGSYQYINKKITDYLCEIKDLGNKNKMSFLKNSVEGVKIDKSTILKVSALLKQNNKNI